LVQIIPPEPFLFLRWTGVFSLRQFLGTEELGGGRFAFISVTSYQALQLPLFLAD
jgi:hypothetical protein